MKAKLLLSTMLLALAAAARADVPLVIDHQGYLTTDSGTPVTGERTMVFTLYDAAEGGQALWTETQSVTVAGGLFNVFLGDVAALPDTVFTGQALFLGVRVGTDSEMTPRIRLGTVPYAFASGRDALPARRWFQDADGDLFGNRYVWVPAVGQPAGYVADSTDCNDANAAVHPGAAETCDGVDSNCDLADGYPETCNGLDDDCSGTADDNLLGPLCPLQDGVCAGARMRCEGTWMVCGDGEYGPYYEQIEVSCDGLDNDCDGQYDENADCDDGIPCTLDQCSPSGCQHSLADGMCLIGGVCYDAGESSPSNYCFFCDPTKSQTNWTYRGDGVACPGGFCQGGYCQP